MLRTAIFIGLFLSLPVVAFGSSVMRSGDSVSISVDQAVEGDFYGFAKSVVVSGTVSEDLLVSATDVTINGQVGSDLSAVAGRVDVHGLVGDDVRIVAGEVTVAGEVNGDLVVVAGSLKVLSTAKIGGDIIFYGTDADINGKVGNSIFGTSEKIRVNGEVGGDIDINTANLVLGEGANINGVVKYISNNELTRAQNAQVVGKVIKNSPTVEKSVGMTSLLIPFLVSLFAALVWFLFFRNLLERVVILSDKHMLRSVLIGFGIFFLLPIAALILIVSTLGSLLGLSLIFIYLVLLFVSISISGVILGAQIAKLVVKSPQVTIPFVLVGTLGATVLFFIPVVGPVIFILLLLLTLGSLAVHLYRLVRLS